MPPSGKRLIYWDSSVFLAWLKNEKREPGVMEGIEDVVQAVNAGKVNLCTSVVTQTEIFESRLSDDAREKFRAVFQRRNVVMINVDQKIATLASQIRDYYNQRSIDIRVPDSTHLATAILYKADELQTLDGSGSRPRPSDLISLSGNVAGHPLLIRVPMKDQLSLF